MKKTALVILDGWGIAQIWGGNAIGLANTPTMDKLYEKYPHTTLEAAGGAVGLPYEEAGNSEVGHLNIGSGQVVYQGLTAINEMIKNDSFFHKDVLIKTMKNTLDGKKLHLVGLLSNGGIHSEITHLFALLKLAKNCDLTKVYLHIFTDGRDSAPTSGSNFIKDLQEKMKALNLGTIATISGRYFGMDRDNHWDRIKKVYDAMVLGEGYHADDASSAILRSYASGVTDEFIVPTVIDSSGLIEDNDSIIFFNFRSDRARQLTRAFLKPDFTQFDRRKTLKNLFFTTFTTYQEGLPTHIAFERNKVGGPLSWVLTDHQLKHFHLAETEKYAHVTYFFNGELEKPFDGEERLLIPSPAVATFDLLPEMSAEKIAQNAVTKIPKFDFTVINFANADMVGHTGNFKATVKAVETVDHCLDKLIKTIIENKMTAIITADHGNAEQMINPLTGQEDTEHTNNPVPFILVNHDYKDSSKIRTDGKLSDISPTIVELMGLEKSKEMTGESLLIK